LDQDMHQEMISMYLKFMIVIFLIYQCVDTELHLKMFLCAHVIGCFTLGWIAYTSYTGGRFEGFDAPGLAEANSGAMQLVTAAFFGASLFLAANTRAKIVLAGLLAFVANAIITTQSRSGFLSLGLGGLVFNFFSPPRYKKLIRVLSVLGIAAMLAITTDAYWARMRSLEHAGEKVEGVDTGEGRIVLVKAQWLMFKDYPFGCGHRCTAVLSPRYLDDSQLTGAAGQDRVRSSHNTFMSLVVEHGIFGAMFYFVYLLWVLSSLRKFSKAFRNSEGFMATLLPAIAAVAVAMTLGDMFVDYLTFEMRIWIMAILMVLVSMATKSLQLAVEERTRSGNFGPRIVPALSSDRLRAGN